MRRPVAVAGMLLLLVACTGLDEEALHQEQAELLGLHFPGDSQTTHQVRFAGQLQVQELIVECMAEAGFDYLPVPPSGDPRLDGSMTQAEYKERYGWGMLSSTRETLMRNRQEVDPNQALLDQMDEPTLLAWQDALYGPEDTRLDSERREGCEAWAEDEAYGYQQAEAWAELKPLLDKIPQRILSHPDTIRSNRAWSECMAEHGYELDQPDDAVDLIQHRIYEVWSQEPTPPGETPMQHEHLLEPWFVHTDSWQRLVEFELELSALDTACSQDEDVVAQIYDEFLDEHQDLIRQYQAELEQLEHQR